MSDCPAAAAPATLVVAGLSVRGLAESARRAGWRVIGLDAFGDQDTRRACAAWHPIGTAGGDLPRIDGARLRAALDTILAALPEGSRLLGCVTGAGFEAQPALLDDIARRVPLLGLGRAAIAPLRDPARCFATAAALGIDHPEVSLLAPSGPGWLFKDMAASGGQGVRRWSPPAAVDAAPAASGDSSVYWQRETAGRPVGTLVLADGERATLLGVHEQLIDPTPALPWRFAGVVGPLPLTPGQRSALQQALDRLVWAHGLRGLVSVDWLLDGERWWLLEVNPRPSASLALHERLQAAPWLAAHVAQFDAEAAAASLAAAPAAASAAAAPAGCPPAARGELVVYAPQALVLDALTLGRWAARDDVHDLPTAPPAAEPLRLPAGAPLCSLSASGASPADVRLALQRQRLALLADLVEPVGPVGLVDLPGGPAPALTPSVTRSSSLALEICPP